jgi:hypothetical protein
MQCRAAEFLAAHVSAMTNHEQPRTKTGRFDGRAPTKPEVRLGRTQPDDYAGPRTHRSYDAYRRAADGGPGVFDALADATSIFVWQDA